ncbi:MAG: tetratricopeptide repeat protein [Phycisphaerales bacterium JB038]
MQRDRWLCLSALAFLCAVGCSTTSPPASTAGLAPDGSGSAMPVTNYKSERWQQAIAGLTFDSGRVAIDRTVADGIAAPGALAEAQAAYDAGMAEMEQGHREWAVGHFRTAVLIAPFEPSMYEGLGYGLLSKGKSDQALAAYRTALDLQPARLSALVGAARSLDSASRAMEALTAWRDVLAVEPQHAAAHSRLASLYYFAADYERALAHYERAEALGHHVPVQLRPLIEAQLQQANSN